jgi:hypothetical protein
VLVQAYKRKRPPVRVIPPPVALFGLPLVAHSGGGGYDYPYDNSYDLSYYGDVPLVRDERRNSANRESLVGLAPGDAVRIAGHVLRVLQKNFKCNMRK